MLVGSRFLVVLVHRGAQLGGLQGIDGAAGADRIELVLIETSRIFWNFGEPFDRFTL